MTAGPRGTLSERNPRSQNTMDPIPWAQDSGERPIPPEGRKLQITHNGMWWLPSLSDPKFLRLCFCFYVYIMDAFIGFHRLCTLTPVYLIQIIGVMGAWFTLIGCPY